MHHSLLYYRFSRDGANLFGGTEKNLWQSVWGGLSSPPNRRLESLRHSSPVEQADPHNAEASGGHAIARALNLPRTATVLTPPQSKW